MLKYPADLLKLMGLFKKLPSVGGKTAERFAFQLLNWSEDQLKEFSYHLAVLKEKIKSCPECFCIMQEETCPFCQDTQRDKSLLCVIASPKDAYALEETHTFQGLYHVLGGLLSPLEKKHPEQLHLEALKKRLSILSVKEVIIALDSTLEGDATALYLKELLTSQGITASRLAFGLPIGSSLEYVDGGTLARALSGRQTF